ncbi:hypothetical protein [Methylomicrobium lacus]|uniref:hypothetical protein n=1 Tax=Methylomicrobium lacus TaxID=136992 RepID=UPI0035A976E8
MKKKTILSVLSVVAATAIAQPAFSEAIWTSLVDGSEVNFNIYASKELVYLNGGPGKGAGTNAKGLDDGIYVFMVTDPSGKTLLSTDPAGCRQVKVVGGVFAGVVATGGCVQHATGSTPGGSVPVQLFPYDDTPNNGGEYKAWLTPIDNYGCADLSIVDCDQNTHGFVPSDSKTDNFKVGPRAPHEIDTRFYDENGAIMDGLRITWTDTLGARNKKYSYWAPEVQVNHEAHVEAPELGIHQIEIVDQLGCSVQEVYVAGVKTRQNGPQTISVRVTQPFIKKQNTTFVDVHCTR